MLYEGKVSTTLKALASRHCGSCSSPNVNTICVLSLFVFFVIALRSLLAEVPIFPLLKTTLAHSNSIWNAQALSNNNKILIYGKSRPPSPKIKHGGEGGQWGWGEGCCFILSCPRLEFLSS